MKTLYIRDKITNGLNLSSDGYLTYIGFLRLLRKDINMYYVTPTLLSHLLTDLYPPNRQIIHSLINGINELAEKQIIILSQSNKQHEWIIDTSVFDEDKSSKNYYTTIEDTDVKNILLSNPSHFGSALSLLRFYVYIVSTIHKKNSDKQGVGFTSLDNISESMDITKKTVSSYFNKLEELKLLYVYRPKDSIVFNSGEIREMSAAYGKYIDKEIVAQVGKEYEETYGSDIKNKFKKVNRESGAKTRGASQKYNFMDSCTKEGKEIPYSYDEIKEIYETMIYFNDKYKGEEKRIKDLTIFKDYDFYKG